MSLCETIQKFIDDSEKTIETLPYKSKEYVILYCKISYSRKLLYQLNDIENVIRVREEFRRVLFSKTYAGEENEQLIKDFETTDLTLLF